MKQALIILLTVLVVLGSTLPGWLGPKSVGDSELVTLEDGPLAFGELNLGAVNAFGLNSPWLDGVVINAVGDANNPGYTGQTRSQIEAILGAPAARYGNTTIAALNNATRSYYLVGEELLLVFYDNKQQSRALFTLQFGSEVASRTRYMTTLPSDQENLARMTQDTLTLLNGVRSYYQRGALKASAPLAAVALKHSQDMLDKNYFSHTNSAGLGPKARIQAAKISFRAFGEALTAGTYTPVDALTAWLNSDGHRPILLGDYNTAGLGIASGTSGYGIYYTLKVIKQ